MFTKYVVTTLKKYPGLVFQKFIHGFGKSVEVPEVRTYWVGEEYQFSMIATDKKIYCLAGEGHKPQGRKQNGIMRLPKPADIETLKNIAKRVIDVLQSNFSVKTPGGGALPLLMTRVDMGVMRDGEFKPWVNEVEYVPSYYVEDHTHPIEGTVAKQCAVIAKKFLGIDSFVANSKDSNNSSQMNIPSSAAIDKSSQMNILNNDVLDCDFPLVAASDLDTSIQMDNPPDLAVIPTSPISKGVLPSEPDADMCMDISFVDS